MLKKIINDVKIGCIDLIKYDYKYLICLILTSIICFTPVNYYITVGGGISDIESRIQVENAYSSIGSFNLSYVSEADGVLLTYLLSYIIPSWERSSIDDYKYESIESIKDIEFRNQLDLDIASSNALKVAFEKAEKPIVLESTKTYVISVHKDFTDCGLLVGDEIKEMDGKVLDSDAYRDYIQSKQENDIINIKVVRNGKEKIVSSTVHKVDDRIMLGVYLKTLNTYQTSPKTTIQFKKEESGPSAGLMTTLEIYNQLVKEDITKGLKIAGTGTIDGEGKVGQIGGVEYKLLGAVHGKADVFLVPLGDNYEEVKKIAKEKNLKIKIIAVSTFEEALKRINNLK